MKRLYSQPLVAIQETKCVVISPTLLPLLHFTVNVVTKLNTLGLDTLGIIMPLRSKSGFIFTVSVYLPPGYLYTWVHIFSFVNERFLLLFCFCHEIWKTVSCHNMLKDRQIYTTEIYTTTSTVQLMPVRSRVIKHHIFFSCMNVTLHYTSVAAQQTKQAYQPFCPATTYPRFDT